MRKESDFLFKANLNNISDTELLLFNRLELIKKSNPSKICMTGVSLKNRTDLYSSASSEIEIFCFGDVYYRSSSKLYNYNVLSDEDLLRLYIKEGKHFVNQIKGSFTIIVKDSKNENLTVFTDQLNPRSVYYYFIKNVLIISSSLSVIIKKLQDENTKVTINQHSIFQYYLYNYITGSDTFIEDIYETEPGQLIVFNNNGIKISTYYNHFEQLNLTSKKLNIKEGEELLKNSLNKNVALYDKGPEETAVALTGGFDSRAVLASLGTNYKDYEYYSYGKTGNWDTKIPAEIADKVNLKYTPIPLDKSFDENFSENGEKAVLLSDGVGTFSMANYPYVYSSFVANKENILTGLFGSELIKYPSSRGLFVTNNMIDILFNENKREAVENQTKNPIHLNFFSESFLEENGSLLLEKVSSDSFIANNKKNNEKLFYFLMHTGFRKYFQKELKIESPWVRNLHPFYDIDFVEAIVKTPFLWVYNWTDKKSLIKNLKIHKIYTNIINQKPVLSRFMSTHGYKPKHLNSILYLPLLALEFFQYKKKIKSETSMTFTSLISDSVKTKSEKIDIKEESIFSTMMKNADRNDAQFVKMFSLLFWFKAHDIDV